MSALSSAKELAQLFERAVSQHLCSRAPRPLKTSRDWCTMRVEPFPFSRFSLTFLSLLLKKPHSNHQTDVTVFIQGCAPALMTDQVRQGRHASTFALGAWSAFTILWGRREAPTLPQCIRASISPHSGSNPPRVLLINAFAKATEVFWLVFCAALQAKEAHCS